MRVFTLNVKVNEAFSSVPGKKKMNVCIHLYADDIALISDNDRYLQQMLNFVHEWCNQWKLSVNTTKTQVVQFKPLLHPVVRV